MAIEIDEHERRIVLAFTATLDDGRTYNDALHMTASEFATSTIVSRREIARDRVRAWVNAVDNPPAPVVVTDQERRRLARERRAAALEEQASAERELAATEADTPDGA